MVIMRRSRHDGYEPLAETRRNYARPWDGLRLYIALFLTYSAMALAYCLFSMVHPADDTGLGKPPIPIPGDRREHTIPTPLSVVHPETGKYINALTNPLYEQLKSAEFRLDRQSTRSLRRPSINGVMEFPKLFLDKTALSIREPITLSWTLGKDMEGNPLVKDDDVLCLYCPASERDPLKFSEAATMAQVRATSLKHGGSDEHEWHIPSFSIMRQESCQFRLYQSQENLLYWFTESPIFRTPDSKRTPTALHLAWTNDTSQMLIQFTTGESGTPVVMYGIDGTTTKAEGISQTYAASDMCQAPANISEAGKFQPPGMLHVVKMTDLQPSATYKYKVGLASGQGITWSGVYTFRTAPPVGDPDPFSYVVYGDQGCPSDGWGDGGVYTAAMAAREVNITQVHHFGDLSYARGAAHIWDEWFHMISPFTARIPLMIGVGNHEYDHTEGGENGKDPSGLKSSHGFMPSWGNFGEDSGGECGVPTSRRFHMPETGNGVFWYSYSYASVHTIMLSSEHDLSQGSPQYTWLEAELKSVDRTLIPWLVVESHRPLYEAEDFWDQNLVTMGMRYEIEDLLYKHKVDMFLAGHYHAYFRTCDGLYHSKCDQGGPVHITVGSAGAMLDSGVLYEQEWTRAFRNQEYGYGRITIQNSTALHFEFVKAGAQDDPDAGSVLDDVWITRDR